MFDHQPPAVVQLPLALAVDAMQLAEVHLAGVIEVLAGDDADAWPIDGWTVAGHHTIVRHFLRVLAGVKGERLIAMAGAIRANVDGIAENALNPVGLRKAAVSLEFAVASLDQATEELERVAGPDDASLFEAIAAASYALQAIGEQLEGAIVRRLPGFGPPSMN